MKRTALVICCLAFLAVSAQDAAVRVWTGTLALPTSVEGPANPNPSFDLFTFGRLNYPYPIRDALSDRREPVSWRTLNIENEYLRLTVLPDLGGHVYSCLDKRTGREMFYANPSIKKALIGYRGAWAAFGIEFNFPVSHNWVTSSPVDHATLTHPDGSVSIVVGNVDLVYGMQWRVELTLRPGRAVLEQRTTLYNRGDLPHRFYWWTNAAVEVWDDSHLLYPMDFTAAHGFAQLDSWPVDARGVDLSRPGNHTFGPVSLFAHASHEGFMGVYHPRTRAGVEECDDANADDEDPLVLLALPLVPTPPVPSPASGVRADPLLTMASISTKSTCPVESDRLLCIEPVELPDPDVVVGGQSYGGRVASLAADALTGDQIDPDSLTRAISAITSTNVFLIAKNGEILSRHSMEPLVDSAYLLSVPIEKPLIEPGDKAWHKFVTIGMRRYLQVQTDLAGGQRLLMVKSFSTVSQLKARMREVILWSSFLGLIALVAVAFWVSAKITQPLEKLTEQANKIRLWGLPEKTEIKSPDEVGELADALNEIIDNLKGAKQDLSKAEQVQRDLYRGFGPRLERPMAAIVEKLDFLTRESGSIDVESREMLEQSLEQARKVRLVIRTLIEISQLEFGEIAVKLKPVLLHDLLDAVHGEFAAAADRKGLRFEISCEPEDLAVQADAVWLKVAIENLVSNAIDFSDDGIIRIECEGSGSMATIRIIDSGRGIPQDQIDKIFEHFYSVEPGDDRVGLGLVLAREIVRSHGQKLEVQSRLGVGSQFSFRLQRAQRLE